MATLVNRDWWTVDAHGQPLRVRCLSHNVVIGTARVVAGDGVFAEIDARELHHSPEAVRACAKTNADGIWTTLSESQWWCCTADYPNHIAGCENAAQ